MKPYLIISLALILAFHAAGTLFSWYTNVTWVDIPMHFAGGVWVGFLFFYLFEERWQIWKSKEVGFMRTCILSLGFVALIGVLWEFYEYLLDTFVVVKYSNLGPQLGGLTDTLADLLNDLLGGTLATAIWYLRRKEI